DVVAGGAGEVDEDFAKAAGAAGDRGLPVVEVGDAGGRLRIGGAVGGGGGGGAHGSGWGLDRGGVAIGLGGPERGAQRGRRLLGNVERDALSLRDRGLGVIGDAAFVGGAGDERETRNAGTDGAIDLLLEGAGAVGGAGAGGADVEQHHRRESEGLGFRLHVFE